MYIQLCDRCGRVTKNKVSFLLPNKKQLQPGSYNFNGVWFGDEGVCLCNNCLEDFENFRTKHDRFNISSTLTYEKEK